MNVHQYFNSTDPDANLIALFKNIPVKNETESIKQGRPVYDDREVCEIRVPGSANWCHYPSTSISHWANNPLTGEQTPVTYAERFPRQYQQWKAAETQTKSGTPLDYLPFLTPARRAEMRALNIYTAEQLAGIEGAELKNLGQNGRALKNSAQEFLAEAAKGVPNAQMAAELEALRARTEILEEDNNRLLKERNDKIDSKFDDMSVEQLREFITAKSGHAPMGSLNRKTLTRLAMDCA